MEGKFAKLKSGSSNPFIDPEGYHRYVRVGNAVAFRS